METQITCFDFDRCQLLTRRAAQANLGVGQTTLKVWRLGDRRQGVEPRLLQGVHWFQPSHGLILYNVTMIRDWLANPDTHHRAVEAFLASQPSSQV
ncbi:MAG: hypothetical protein WBG32_00870 [Nodosilinea sp.]